MTQLEGQTGEPLSYQFQFVVCAHHDQPVDARLDGARVLHGDIKHLDAVVNHGLTLKFPTMADNAPILVIVPPRTGVPGGYPTANALGLGFGIDIEVVKVRRDGHGTRRRQFRQ
jgi:hypothetical protein